ncbi:metallophosphoesterase [Legionella gresilensis]|uniref:metallophosphoesterase n=1 Tax=Legionella gresilensis TaxID=91823 RepID=UPI0013EF7B09|nr:metallophosphoesterase [Legionella gresilensis]
MNKLLKILIGFFIFFAAQPTWPAIRFLALSDIHYGANNITGNGHDTGDILWSSALEKFKTLQQDVDFILLLGDLPTHHFPFFSKVDKAQYEAKIFHDLFITDNTHKPIYYVPGNNDSLAGNYQPFAKQGKSPLSYAYDWQGACAYCDGLMIDKTAMESGGYYATYVLPKNKDIILIVLNATQFAKLPLWIPSYLNQDDDAEQQLEWLATQLKNHQAKQLLIAMHEEPGIDYRNKKVWKDKPLTQFIKLLNKYHKNYQQISLLTSHSHYDELRKITLKNGKAIYAYSTPSISRRHYNNPAMKIFHLNDDLILQDFTTYFTNDEARWGDDHYYAINSQNNIFSTCKDRSLAACLNSLNTEKICELMEGKAIYSTKNEDKKGFNCLKSYNIN